ncbi:MAG: hypothetical protein DRJ38_00350 [Thermoprotei archaeon]|nr:MAG: hypothetical protein DRJ38_00350 [Thermoprotei archaeon]
MGLSDVAPLDIIIRATHTEIYFDAKDGLRTKPSSVLVEVDGELVELSKLIDAYRELQKAKRQKAARQVIYSWQQPGTTYEVHGFSELRWCPIVGGFVDSSRCETCPHYDDGYCTY